MPRGKRSRIKIPEMTSDSPKQIKASQARVGRLKSRGGYVANPKDRGEMLYGKGNEPKGVGRKPKTGIAAKPKAIGRKTGTGGVRGLKLGRKTTPKPKKK